MVQRRPPTSAAGDPDASGDVEGSDTLIDAPQSGSGGETRIAPLHQASVQTGVTGVSTRAEPLRDPQSTETSTLGVPTELIAGRYCILGLLGVGGMGRVYRARDMELGEL